MAAGPVDVAPAAVAVDVVVLTIIAGELSALLVRRSREPGAGRWSLPGCRVHPDERLEKAARRALVERAGAADLRRAGHLEQLRTYGDPGRDPRGRVLSVGYVMFVPDPPVPAQGGWLPATRRRRLAFDHAVILADGVERARAKLEYTPLATAFVNEPFTLPGLRRIYEAVWGAPLDPANFRRKVLSTPGLVEPVGRTAAPAGGGRPGELYRRGPARTLHPAMLRPATPR
jgi:8-oxo-dGTP diphosphatase